MKKELDVEAEILDNFEFSIKSYNKKFQSYHWLYNNIKKKKLFKKKKFKKFSKKRTIFRHG